MSAAYARRFGLEVVDLGEHDADLEPEEAVDLAHPLGVALGQVVVDGDEVDAVAGERVEVRGQRGDEGLALAGLHLRDPAEVQRGAAHDLDVEVALAERAHAGLADRGERLGEEVVEVLAALVVDRRPGRAPRAACGEARAARRRSGACISGSKAPTTRARSTPAT